MSDVLSLIILFILFGMIQAQRDPINIDCTGAPPQYIAAGSWIDAGKRVKCAEGGEKGYLFYSDAQIPSH